MNKIVEFIITLTIAGVMSTSAVTPTNLISEEVVIVLDAGHDGSHGGAYGGSDWYKEANLNLKVAMYCKEELEKYDNVTVYMVRETSACPSPGTTSEECNNRRASYAKSVNADYFISFHMNAGGEGMNGFLVFYPNENYNAAIGQEGKVLAGYVQEELVKLGLKNNGILSSTATKPEYDFPDGSKGDTYRVIRENKKVGVTGIIIEHAFLTYESDKERFLSSEEKLKALGVADAKGILNFLEATQN